MKRGSIFAALLVLLGLSSAASARLGFPEPVTGRAEVIEDLYFQITLAGIIVFVFVMVLLGFILIRFREGGKGRATFEMERDNLKAEMVWTVIPLIIMLWIGVISYQGLVELDNLDGSFDSENALVIDITASQYAWQAEYQDSGAKVLAVANQDWDAITPFYIPENTPILFRVTAVDVIHAFNVPQMGVLVDAVPGTINEVPVAGGAPEGVYFTQCRENCRTPGHSYMQASIHAVPAAEYAQWSADTLAGKGGVEQVLPVIYDGASITAMGTDLLARGALAHIQVLNDADSAVDFTFAGETISVPGKGLNTFDFKVEETGTFAVTGGGASLDLNAVEPEIVSLDLGSFVLEPATLNLMPGKLYILNVENVHSLPHNLYIGTDGADGKTDANWYTGNLGAGDKESIIIAPTEASTLDMWCAVSGHYSAGMYGTVTVA